MTQTLAGFVGAAIAGAVLGYAQEWLSASGGWDEMHLGFATIRGVFLFVLAYGACYPWRRVRPFGPIWPLLIAPFLGATLFVLVVFVPEAVAYYARFPAIWHAEWPSVLAEHVSRSTLFGTLALAIMLANGAIAGLIEKATRWDERGLK